MVSGLNTKNKSKEDTENVSPSTTKASVANTIVPQVVTLYGMTKENNTFKCYEVVVDIARKEVHTVKAVESNTDDYIVKDRLLGIIESMDI